jgi:hypothetical protein
MLQCDHNITGIEYLKMLRYKERIRVISKQSLWQSLRYKVS